MANEKILVVDDEEHILELIRFNLEGSGFQAITATNGEDALRLCNDEQPDLILLDIMLPGIDGLEVCRKLKSEKETRLIPIIMITAKGEEIDKIVGLELGADDYITKPFSVRELLARVKALLRRTRIFMSEAVEDNIIKVGDLVINSSTYEVYKGQEKIELTLKEFGLLKLLAQNREKVLTRDFLLDKVWGYEYYGESRTVDVHIRYLRQKLEKVGLEKCIETVRGVGYRFVYRGNV